MQGSTIVLSGTIAEMQKQAAQWANILETTPTTTTFTGATPAPKRGRPVKAEAAETEENFGVQAEEDTGIGFEDDAQEKAPHVTKADLNEALKAYAKANGGKEATLKLLKKKFKVNGPQELKESQYTEVVEFLTEMT